MTPAQVALSWVVHRARELGVAAVPIPGTKHRARLEQNAAALDLELTTRDLVALEPIAGEVAGGRTPALPPHLRRLLPDTA